MGCPASIPCLAEEDAVVSASSPCSQGPDLAVLGSNKASGLSLGSATLTP